MADYEREDVRHGVVPDIAGSKFGLASQWGLGNQVLVHAGVRRPKQDESSDLTTPPSIHIVKWDIDMHNPVTRKLVNESHNVFISLQSHNPEQADTVRKPQLVKFSRHYRSVQRACVLELQLKGDAAEDEEKRQIYYAQCQVFSMIELIWSLCEILFVEVLPGGVILNQLLDWVSWHFTQGDELATAVMSSSSPHTHESYWPAIYIYVLQGRIDDARKLLSIHPDRQRDVNDLYGMTDELLRKMPMFTVVGRQSVAEFDMKWRHWQDQCQQCLEDGLFDSHNNLSIICRILAGDNRVFSELKDLTQSWYQMLVAKLLYNNPTIKTFDIHYHAQECIDDYGGNSHLSTLDNILLSALEFDIHQVIRESSAHLNNWWFVAHLTDLLYHCGQLESHNLNFGSNLREFLLLEYATSLMSHESLWQIGMDYLDHCPEVGRHYLELYIERIPIQTERKALKVLRACEKRGMELQAHSICKEMGMKALQNDRLGTALSWCIRSKDRAFATFLSEKFLSEYSSRGGFSNLDLIDNLGPAMLLSDRLTFLGKYREFHKMYEHGEFREAANLLLSLLSAKLAPQKFWLTLLTDALPLLECDQVVFSSHQTYDLMHCLEEITLSFQSTQYLDKDDKQRTQGQREADQEKIDLLRLALARNLSRAILHEGTEIEGI
ncbi:nuclear pore complex protein Nup85-like [Saccoglossus kowalevskii]|uniref:Nuclear pore complex protein Nup85 n=1 Tax=Saccoglossus kowalevskii TaxID=10224 RepID=A0ABM0LWC4_SACKO|nr:PREDICTED: nuclear pore complex protein Nup85-like [Saccoglossus kowalevskii]